MADVKSKSDLLASIAGDIADNNAGLISAEDVRTNMADTVASINGIVASGDTAGVDSFVNNVKITKSTSDGTTGKLIVGSGVEFPDGLQTVAYPGEAGITHNNLGGLTTGDPHVQYLPTIIVAVLKQIKAINGSSFVPASVGSGLRVQLSTFIEYVLLKSTFMTVS